MFIGHFALGFAAKRVAPRTSLGTLFAAAEFADILFAILVLFGWESVGFVGGTDPFLTIQLDHYPISHGLLALIAWGIVVALLYRWRRGYARGAVVVALLVVSHWVLDFVTHRPDMPLWPGGPKVGLELWASVPGTIVVEGLLFAAGVWVYASATRARDAVGRCGTVGTRGAPGGAVRGVADADRGPFAGRVRGGRHGPDGGAPVAGRLGGSPPRASRRRGARGVR